MPRSICACLAQPRSVSALILSTSRIAVSRSLSGYFRAAPIFPLSRGLGASTKPGAIQSPFIPINDRQMGDRQTRRLRYRQTETIKTAFSPDAC